MKSFILILLTIFMLTFFGCEDDTEGPEYSPACDDASAVEIAGDVSPVPDSDPDTETSVKALDLVGTPTVTFEGTTLTCVITIDDIPASEELLIYHDELTQGYLNYQWAVKFDIEGDLNNDYTLALSLFNGTLAEQDGNMNTMMQASLWDATGTGATKIADADLEIVSNNPPSDSVDSITLSITDAAVADFAGAQEIHAETMMNNGIVTYKDCRQIKTSY
ncbi:MAG TPA: hypothetical protein DCO79_02375 [Spirochaeta sp.]|nr:hypothetical protein [Spirochaeta sp.]